MTMPGEQKGRLKMEPHNEVNFVCCTFDKGALGGVATSRSEGEIAGQRRLQPIIQILRIQKKVTVTLKNF